LSEHVQLTDQLSLDTSQQVPTGWIAAVELTMQKRCQHLDPDRSTYLGPLATAAAIGHNGSDRISPVADAVRILVIGWDTTTVIPTSDTTSSKLKAR
jgi:hypothetical protein